MKDGRVVMYSRKSPLRFPALILPLAIVTIGGCSRSSAAPIELRPLNQSTAGRAGVSIINGQNVDPDDFPVSFRSVNTEGDVCTFFLVGPQTLASAAHCVVPGLQVVIRPSQETEYAGKCEVPKGYPADESQDWALCLLDKRYSPPLMPGKPLTGYEVIDVTPARVRLHQRILISGFGCEQEGKPALATYKVGWASISELPPSVRIPGAPHSTPNAMKLVARPAQLCGGDSGGPAFSSVDDALIYRSVVGVNSRTAYDAGYSYLASLTTKSALDFLKTWATAHGQKICGIHPDAPDCRPVHP